MSQMDLQMRLPVHNLSESTQHHRMPVVRKTPKLSVHVQYIAHLFFVIQSFQQTRSRPHTLDLVQKRIGWEENDDTVGDKSDGTLDNGPQIGKLHVSCERRVADQGVIAPVCKFELEILFTRSPSDHLRQKIRFRYHMST